MEKVIRYETDTPVKRLVTSKLFWALFCGFFFLYPLLKSVNRELPDQLPVIYQLPSYQLKNQFNKPFGSADLKGKAYIASFFFTSCPSVCPKLMDEMVKIQHRVRGLGTNVALLSFTVDPENDTPETLYKNAVELKANPYIWFFLTGEESELKEILNGGFKVAMGDKEQIPDTPLYDIAHSEKLALVDGEGRIRGFYSSDKDGINRLMIDLGLLVNREAANQG